MMSYRWSIQFVRFAPLAAMFVAATIGLRAARAELITMIDNGPADNRVNVVFLGDGYTASELETTYVDHIDAMLLHLFHDGEDPFPRYENFFNVHRVEVVSNQSGADIPSEGIYRDTALNASYSWGGGVERLLYVSEYRAGIHLNQGLSGAGFSADVKLVTVNEQKYGGGGGGYAVFAGGNDKAPDLALHELGHAFADLADEYGSGTGSTYFGPEPSEVNVTKSPGGEKWAHWIGYDQGELGLVGVYEGGRYYDKGLYRPSLTSKMRALGVPFDAVSREQFILSIYELIDPLDDFLTSDTPLVDPTQLWVDAVDPEVIDVEWLVDGAPLVGLSGEVLSLADTQLDLGTYTITARAADPTDWVRIDRELLEQSVSWTVEITTPVPEPAGVVLLILGSLLIGWRWPART